MREKSPIFAHIIIKSLPARYCSFHTQLPDERELHPSCVELSSVAAALCDSALPSAALSLSSVPSASVQTWPEAPTQQ